MLYNANAEIKYLAGRVYKIFNIFTVIYQSTTACLQNVMKSNLSL